MSRGAASLSRGAGAGYWFALEGADEPGGINQPIWQIIDWVFYRTAGDLVDAAPDVFTGRVKEISFAVVDDTAGTGLNRLLYTLYTSTPLFCI